jgi:hypothetical protein
MTELRKSITSDIPSTMADCASIEKATNWRGFNNRPMDAAALCDFGFFMRIRGKYTI